MLLHWLPCRRISLPGRCIYGMIVLNTGLLALFGIGMFSEIKFLRPKYLLAADNDEQFIIWKPKYLVWSQHPTTANSLCIAVLWDDLCQSNALPEWSWWN